MSRRQIKLVDHEQLLTEWSRVSQSRPAQAETQLVTERQTCCTAERENKQLASKTKTSSNVGETVLRLTTVRFGS